MKKATCLCLSIMCAFFLTGCFGAEKLDTSNEKAYVESFKTVYEALPEPERRHFLDNFKIVIDGTVIQLNSQMRNSDDYLGYMDYNDAVELYKAAQFFGGRQAEASLQELHGKTSSDIIKEGQTILKKTLDDELITLHAVLQEQEKKLEEIKQIKAAKEQITVEIINPVQGRESTKPNEKGKLAAYIIPIIIKNNSSFTVLNFNNDVMDFVKNYTNKPNTNAAFGLSEFIAEGGKQPFKSSFFSSLASKTADDAGIAPGQILKGEIVLEAWTKIPYPLTEEYEVAFRSKDALTPILKGVYKLNSHDRETQTLNKAKERINMVNAELAKLS